MVIARRVGNDFQVLEKFKCQVRLAEGLQADLQLDQAAFNRAFRCLDEFSQGLQDIPPDHLRAVATYTLRTATNADDFIQQALAHFPAPIEIISGQQEAHLIYQGVTHISDIHDQVLVIDIGGGSTEYIIGREFEEIALNSCPVGCINLGKSHFSNGKLNAENFKAAEGDVKTCIATFADFYRAAGWKFCLGSSGSIKAIARILKAQGFHKRSITLDHLLALKAQLIEFKQLDRIEIEGLSDSRAAILPAAVAILIASFESLHIDRMEYSRGALREGLLYEMI